MLRGWTVYAEAAGRQSAHDGNDRHAVGVVCQAHRFAELAVPKGADAVVRVEDTQPGPGENEATILFVPGMGLASIITMRGYMLP